MKNIYLSCLLLVCQIYATAQCSDLFFSEYLEGASNNKAIELYNPTPNPVDLSDYSVSIFTNGATTVSSTFYPKGILASSATYVMMNSSADSILLQPLADTLSGGNVLKFNGDDALVLFHGTDTLDIIGQIGVQPTVGYWDVDTAATKDFSLVRESSVNGGETNWAVNSTQWTAYAKDNFTHIGSHSMDPCNITAIATISENEVDFYPNPSSDYIHIQNLKASSVITIYDVLGNIINCPSLIRSTNATINISHLEKGIYILSVKANGKQIVNRFVKK